MTLRGMMRLLVGVMGARVLGAVLALVSQLILTNLFSQEQVGLILLGMSTTSLVSLFVSMGYPSLAYTKVPQLIAQNRIPTLNAVHAAFMRDTLLLWLLTCVAAYLAVRAGLLNDNISQALFFACVAAIPSSLIRYNSAVANSYRRFMLSLFPDFIVRPALFLAFILGAEAFGYRLSVNQVLWAFVAMIAVIAVALAVALGRQGVLPAQLAEAKPRLNRKLRPRALAMMVTAAVVATHSDIVTLIGGLFAPPHDVALIGVTVRLAAIAAFVIQATQQFILPDMAAAAATRDEARTNALLLRMNYVCVGAMLLGLVATIVLGRFVLSFFGPEYVGGLWLLFLLVLAQAIRAIGGMNQNLLAMNGKQLQTAGACFVALVILAASAAVLTRSAGVIGIGWAVVLAELVWACHLAVLAQRIVGRRGDLFWLLSRSKTR